MVNYATQLGKALEGNMSGMADRGFSLTEAQKQIIETGTDLERVAVLTEMINQNWAGLAESLAKTPEGRIQSFKNKMGDLGEIIGGRVVGGVLKLLDAVDRLIDNTAGSGAIEWVTGGINSIINGLVWMIDKVNAVGRFASANWHIIEPILVGMAAGLVAVKIAQLGLNAAMLANPLTWLFIGIAAIIALLYNWAQSIGGVKVAWLTTLDTVKTAWDSFKIKMFEGTNKVMNFVDDMALAFYGAGVGIANAMGDMKANVLITLQEMINGSIERLNSFIEKVNSLGVVNIGLIEGVEFGTKASATNEAEKAARNAGLSNHQNQVTQQAADRDKGIADMINQANLDSKYRKEDKQVVTARRIIPGTVYTVEYN